MQVLDASAIIHGWDNYPPDQFPKLWEWLAQLMAENELSMASIALEEVGHVSPDCASWLKKETEINVIDVNNRILKTALSIQNLLGIKNDRYGGGVDENDIFIIATAASLNATLISNESKQLSLPKLLANYKIPAVCAMPTVGVTCINYLEFLKRSRKIFA